jgi:hypothetical protein
VDLAIEDLNGFKAPGSRQEPGEKGRYINHVVGFIDFRVTAESGSRIAEKNWPDEADLNIGGIDGGVSFVVL